MPEPSEPSADTSGSRTTRFKGVLMADFLNAFEAFLNADVADSDAAEKVEKTSGEEAAVESPLVPELKAPPDKVEERCLNFDSMVDTCVPSSDDKPQPSLPVKPFVPPIRIRTPAPPPPPIPVIPILPVKGKVNPPTYPPADRPGRNTNQLLYIKRHAMTPMWNHKFSWPFKKPVDAEKLKLPDYHKIITQPMDLGTIKKRIQNKYYWCADECKKDFEQIFLNCNLYNKPDQDIVYMCKELEKVYRKKLQDLMPIEREIEIRPVVPRRQLVQHAALKRAFYTDYTQEAAHKKLKNNQDLETVIPAAQIGVHKQIKSSTNNGEYSDSESESDSDSEESEEESQSSIPPDRFRKDFLTTMVGGGRARGETPLSERKPVKHHCKYCDQPFISRYVRDMHEKQKHILNNYPSLPHEKKVGPTKIVPKPKAETKQETDNAGLQIIPVNQGGVARPEGGYNAKQDLNPQFSADHLHFVDKKHQAVHKQAQRNKDKHGKQTYHRNNFPSAAQIHASQNHGRSHNAAIVRYNEVVGSHNAISGGHNAAVVSGGNICGKGEKSEIPEDMLFSLAEDYSVKQPETDSFSINSPGSEKSNICFGAKQSPDSGYISSRGMPMVDSPGFCGDKAGGSLDKYAMSSEGFESALDTFVKSPVAVTAFSMLRTPSSLDLRQASPAGTRVTSAMSSAGPRMSYEGPLKLSDQRPASRMNEDDRLTDLQKELGFVEPTFPRSLLETGESSRNSQDVKKFNNKQSFQIRSPPMSGSVLPNMIKSSVPPVRPSSTSGIPAQPMVGGSSIAAGRGGNMPTFSTRQVAPPRTTQSPLYMGRAAAPAVYTTNIGLQMTLLPGEPRPISLVSRNTAKSPRLSFEDKQSGHNNPASNKGGTATMSAKLAGRNGVGGGPPKMDVLAQTLKLSDLDFDEFEPEPNLMQDSQTQELKLEDLKHLREETPVPLAAAIRAENKMSHNGAEDLRELLEFSSFSYQDVRPIIGPSQNLPYPSPPSAGPFTQAASAYTPSVYIQAVSAANSGGTFPLPPPNPSKGPEGFPGGGNFSLSSFPPNFEEADTGFSVPQGMDFEMQNFTDRKQESNKPWWP